MKYWTQGSGVGLFDGVEERADVGIFATDEPDRQLARRVAVVIIVVILPRKNSVNEVAVDGDVVGTLLDRCDHSELDLCVCGLVAKYVNQFADSHGTPFGWGCRGFVSGGSDEVTIRRATWRPDPVGTD